MKPNESQIKKFWEWCGLRPYLPEGNLIWDKYDWMPPIDLNNLFKWAMPKVLSMDLDMDIWSDMRNSESRWGVQYSSMTRIIATAYDKDPALALFWAIWKVIEVNK